MASKKYRKKYHKKTKRRKSRSYKRKNNRKRRRTRRKRKHYKLKGGMACVNRPQPSNIGEQYTHYKLNTNPMLPDPQSLNSNLKNVGQKGGFWMNDFGLGDVLLNYYKGMNAMKNVQHTYNGNKHEKKADPIYQTKLHEKQILPYSSADVPDFYKNGSIKAAKYTIF